MSSIFEFVSTDFRRLSCILRRPPDAKICHKLAVCYFSFSKVDFKDRQNERRNKDFSNCDFSRFFVKNNCMLRWPNCRNWSKSVKILSVFFRKIKKSWNFGSEHEFGRFRISNAWKWIVSGRSVEFVESIKLYFFGEVPAGPYRASSVWSSCPKGLLCRDLTKSLCVCPCVRPSVRSSVRSSVRTVFDHFLSSKNGVI